ncbi:hypothetical protein GUJ93_ZPchr0009g1593 [Zizania palustris]|uniref:Uncharacterized protein n=1 Tax=Zizania palustris TaxID=103762 RepID=A0A8J5V8A5_ZIZPA|nr:hypothetical protein GUJ93_ZPchr0009g1593 [Zizania palustris]
MSPQSTAGLGSRVDDALSTVLARLEAFGVRMEVFSDRLETFGGRLDAMDGRLAALESRIPQHRTPPAASDDQSEGGFSSEAYRKSASTLPIEGRRR